MRQKHVEMTSARFVVFVRNDIDQAADVQCHNATLARVMRLDWLLKFRCRWIQSLGSRPVFNTAMEVYGVSLHFGPVPMGTRQCELFD
jgi:hypothetical protein